MGLESKQSTGINESFIQEQREHEILHNLHQINLRRDATEMLETLQDQVTRSLFQLQDPFSMDSRSEKRESGIAPNLHQVKVK